MNQDFFYGFRQGKNQDSDQRDDNHGYGIDWKQIKIFKYSEPRPDVDEREPAEESDQEIPTEFFLLVCG